MIIGKHLIGEFKGVKPSILQNEILLNQVFLDALYASKATVLSSTSHKFSGEGGVTGLFLLSESHASFHSYPEYEYVAVDVFTGGNCDPSEIAKKISMSLAAIESQITILARGFHFSKNVEWKTINRKRQRVKHNFVA